MFNLLFFTKNILIKFYSFYYKKNVFKANKKNVYTKIIKILYIKFYNFYNL